MNYWLLYTKTVLTHPLMLYPHLLNGFAIGVAAAVVIGRMRRQIETQEVIQLLWVVPQVLCAVIMMDMYRGGVLHPRSHEVSHVWAYMLLGLACVSPVLLIYTLVILVKSIAAKYPAWVKWIRIAACIVSLPVLAAPLAFIIILAMAGSNRTGL